ncbi:MAG: MFS transporter [Anaerolineae bacterium]
MKRAIGTYLRRLWSLDRDVRLFLFSSGAMSFTLLNGIFPVLFNLYLLRLGYGPEVIGLVNAAGLLAYAVFAFPAGMIAQRLGVRRAMAVGVAVTMVCSGILPLVEALPAGWRQPWMLGNQILSTAGLALFFVNANPFMVDASQAGERSYAFSTRMVIDTVSGMLGSLAGGALPGLLSAALGLPLEGPAGYRYALLAAAAISLPAVVALLSLRDRQGALDAAEERAAADEQAGAGERTADQPGVAGRAVGPAAGAAPIALLAAMAAVMLLRAAGIGASRVFFNVYLDDGLGVPTVQIGTLFAVIQLASIPAALAMPYLVTRGGLYRVVVWGSLGIAASMLPLALVPHWAAATFGRFGTYALSAIADPALSVYQLELVPRRWRSVMSGVSSTALGVSWTALSFGGGLWIAALGYRTLFLSAAGLSVIGTLLFAALFRPGARATVSWLRLAEGTSEAD